MILVNFFTAGYNHPDISYLYANGILSNVNGSAEISVPLYKKRLINALRPIINGESAYYLPTLKENFDSIKTPHGLNIKSLLQKYTDYIKRRGFLAFDTKNLKRIRLALFSGWIYQFCNRRIKRTYIY